MTAASVDAERALVAPLRLAVAGAFRRLVGRMAAAVLLVLLLPVLLAVAVAVRLDSPGPVLFRQTRLGLRKVPFTMYKFRTMRVDSDDAVHRAYIAEMLTGAAGESGAPTGDQGGLFKLDDPRTTRTGRFLRRSSLDELPQLLNVVRGEMALVGPRPMLDYEVELLPPWAAPRFRVRPGITGLWQVTARSRTDMLGAVRLDVEYVRRRSTLLDLRLLAATVVVLLRRPAAR